jgi:hypothetical protein
MTGNSLNSFRVVIHTRNEIGSILFSQSASCAIRLVAVAVAVAVPVAVALEQQQGYPVPRSY